MTRRPQNICKSCGHTWYPRGSNISLKCPNCGSMNTGVKPVNNVYLILLYLLVVLVISIPVVFLSYSTLKLVIFFVVAAVIGYFLFRGRGQS